MNQWWKTVTNFYLEHDYVVFILLAVISCFLIFFYKFNMRNLATEIKKRRIIVKELEVLKNEYKINEIDSGSDKKDDENDNDNKRVKSVLNFKSDYKDEGYEKMFSAIEKHNPKMIRTILGFLLYAVLIFFIYRFFNQYPVIDKNYFWVFGLSLPFIVYASFFKKKVVAAIYCAVSILIYVFLLPVEIMMILAALNVFRVYRKLT